MIDERIVGFDSNVLTYFLDGNRGSYRIGVNDPVADQRIAAVRVFLNSRAFIAPTVRKEAEAILNPERLEEHVRFIDYSFAELVPDDSQEEWIERRAAALLPHHRSLNDCRIVAELECCEVPVLVTLDKDLKTDLAPHTHIRIETPVECWTNFRIPRGTPFQWYPANGHPLAEETWWRWD